MRVAICITGLDVGGAEILLAEVLRHAPSDLEIHVISLIDGGLLAERIAAQGIEVTGLHMHAGRPNINALFRMVAELRAFRPDVVHTWMYHADLLGGLGAKLAGVPHVVWHLHNSDLDPGRVKLLTRVVVRMLAVLSHWIPDTVISCSEAATRTHAARGYASEKFMVIPNGVDVQRFKPSAEARREIRAEFGLSPDAPLVGMVARVDPQKDHRGFFEAARVFFENGGDADFLLVGRGVTADDPQLLEWRDETGHPDRIALAGPRYDMPRVMASLDVATSSSLGEAFPLVLVEAMSCGVPCVVTDVGDSALIVSDTGITLPSADADALASSWQQILTLPAAERAELGRCARERVLANYSIERTSREIWDLYREIAS